MNTRRSFLKIGAAGLLAGGFGVIRPAWAKYPDAQIRLVSPFSAGGNGDVRARLALPAMDRTLGVSVVPDNRGGGGGNIGAELVRNARPDGYTLLWGANGPLVNSPLMMRSPHYDSVRDFTAIGLMSLVPMVLVVKPDLPVNNIAEFVSYSKKLGGNGVPIGTSGIGGANHVPLERFKAATHANIVHVPYRGGGSALPDLLGGTVDGLFTEVSTVLNLHKSGKVKIIAITAEHRLTLLPNVQTFIEGGLPGFTAYTFNGLWGPAGMAAPLVAQLQAALAASVRDPMVLERMASIGAAPASPVQQTAAGAAAFLKAEVESTRQVMAMAHIEPV
jgi:tripartite-type tricarboxylate transporter receptor subunit TctC